MSTTPKALPSDRRNFLRLVGGASVLSAAGAFASTFGIPIGALAQGNDDLLAGRPMVRYPEKTDLILLTSRPPQLETPMKYFDRAITPNEAFYVRYHIMPPTQVDLATWRLKIGGIVEQPLELSMGDLRNKFERASVTAVNQCSGNSRGYSAPRVFGGQWAHGAMGNAEWTGVRLRDILKMSGVKQGALEVAFNGLDRSPTTSVPDFVKSLTVQRIMEDPNILIAYAMNGEPLPMLNGFPARLVVPGWYATYWVKNLSEITVLDQPFDGFWMRKAYLIPDTPCGCVEPGSTPAHTVPISRMTVRSFIASHANGARVSPGEILTLKGVAFDGGYGIQEVLVSTDESTWQPSRLGPDLGKYSFREWSFNWTPSPENRRVMVRAINRAGESQPTEPLWNPSGYLRNSIESVEVNLVSK